MSQKLEIQRKNLMGMSMFSRFEVYINLVKYLRQSGTEAHLVKIRTPRIPSTYKYWNVLNLGKKAIENHWYLWIILTFSHCMIRNSDKNLRKSTTWIHSFWFYKFCSLKCECYVWYAHGLVSPFDLPCYRSCLKWCFICLNWQILAPFSGLNTCLSFPSLTPPSVSQKSEDVYVGDICQKGRPASYIPWIFILCMEHIQMNEIYSFLVFSRFNCFENFYHWQIFLWLLFCFCFND